MPQAKGRLLSLSPFRRLVNDFVRHGLTVPTVSAHLRTNVSAVRTAREVCVPRPGWCAILTKALAIVASRHPELRRTYLPFPWPHLYEHPHSVAAITIERRLPGEDVVLLARVRRPEDLPLPEFDAYLRRCKQQPLASIGAFRRQLTMARMPGLIRRAAWHIMDWSGAQRARFLGTFLVTSTGESGASVFLTMATVNMTLQYGMIEPNGALDLRLCYDHRIFDGSGAARALVTMQDVLHTEILAELRSLSVRQAA